jgi:hypothetical protein
MHLEAQRERTFAAAQGDMDEVNGVTLAGSRMCDHAGLLSSAMHLDASLPIQRERPFAAAQGDMDEVNGVTPAGSRPRSEAR